MLIVQCNIANTYAKLGRREEAMRMRQEVYSGCLKLNGKENLETLVAASNYALSLIDLQRFKEAKSLMRKLIPMVRGVCGASHDLTIRMSETYAEALYKDPVATLDDLRKAVNTLEDVEGITRRVFGGAHPLTTRVERHLRNARAALRARETQSSARP
tara:strand:+ start:297 stop:770 length:474 start_codon:yes stop_codon:yes gene_type:complete